MLTQQYEVMRIFQRFHDEFPNSLPQPAFPGGAKKYHDLQFLCGHGRQEGPVHLTENRYILVYLLNLYIKEHCLRGFQPDRTQTNLLGTKTS